MCLEDESFSGRFPSRDLHCCQEIHPIIVEFFNLFRDSLGDRQTKSGPKGISIGFVCGDSARNSCADGSESRSASALNGPRPRPGVTPREAIVGSTQ